MKVHNVVTALCLLAGLTACTTNPVTGDKEIALVSESTELAVGREQYAPSRQMQGGDYKLDPQLTRYVQGVGSRLAAVSDRKLPYEFVIINDSTPNAWALPGGKIAINRGLLVELQDEAELAAVLGHEIVHAAARHGAQGMERGMLIQGALATTAAVAGQSEYAGLAVGAASLGANLINQRYSRDAELESDYYGMVYMQRAGYDPGAAVGLQETFVRLSRGRDENWLSGLFASHPPSPERVEKNRQTARAMGQGGRRGREEYQRAIAGLQRDKPAYAAYAEGRALLDKSPEKALVLADKAIAIQPREALFQGLRGDALAARGRDKEARAAYDRAVALDDSFFRHYLQRGRLEQKMGDQAAASRDLQRSLQLLPTADAHYALGLAMLKQDDKGAALKHFQTAAGSSSMAGKAAARELVNLDLPAQPHRYLKTTLYRDRSGRLLLSVRNETSLKVKNLLVLVGRRDASGRIYRGALERVPGTLPPGGSARIVTGISGVVSDKELRRYAAQVREAEVVK